jgi:hypothetical protein
MRNLLQGLVLAAFLTFSGTPAIAGQPIRTCSCTYAAGTYCSIQQKVFTAEGRFLSANVISDIFNCQYCTSMMAALWYQCH